MRGVLVAMFFVAASLDLAAQSGGTGALLKPVNTELQSAPAKNAPLDLPVRKVVLYKNGVGYFEHAGTVQGSQRVAIDFTSSQLNDVLQSLTVLDQGGGRISGVDYNSTTPVEQQLRTLALGLNDYPATLSVYQALRGQRVRSARGTAGEY
jgi:hypothetical protein